MKMWKQAVEGMFSPALRGGVGVQKMTQVLGHEQKWMRQDGKGDGREAYPPLVEHHRWE